MTEYSKKIHLKSNDVARKLLSIIDENKELFISDVLEPTPEEQKVIEEKTTDFAINVIKMLSAEDVKVNYATFPIDKIMASLSGLKQFIDGTMARHEDEYLSRSYGVKNEEGKFRKEEITVGQLMLKLSEVQQATGNNKNDFYNEVAPEMPVDTKEGDTPSPYLGK